MPNGFISERLMMLFLQAIKKIGAKPTESILSKACQYEDPYELSKILIIRNAICKEFSITQNKLNSNWFRGGVKRRNRDTIKWANDVCVYLLNFYLNYTEKAIKDIVPNVDYYKSLNFIKNLDGKIKFHKGLMIKIENIKSNIDEQFKNI
jgi:hypothetical protein